MEMLEKARVEGWTDEEVVNCILGGELELYEIIMRRYNQRLCRVVMSIVRDGAEAEDVMQEAYVRAYEHLRQFEGRAAFSTWLTRIAVHEALARLRKRERIQQFGSDPNEGEISVNLVSPAVDPEQTVSKAELRRMLEKAVLGLPEPHGADVAGRGRNEHFGNGGGAEPQRGERQSAAASRAGDGAKGLVCARGSDGERRVPLPGRTVRPHGGTGV